MSGACIDGPPACAPTCWCRWPPLLSWWCRRTSSSAPISSSGAESLGTCASKVTATEPSSMRRSYSLGVMAIRRARRAPIMSDQLGAGSAGERDPAGDLVVILVLEPAQQRESDDAEHGGEHAHHVRVPARGPPRPHRILLSGQAALRP